MANQTLPGDPMGPNAFMNPLLNPLGIKANPVNAIVMPIFNAVAMIIVYLPMRDFYRKGNFAACSMIVAITMLNLYQFINAIIWQNDDQSTWFSGVGLCDVEVYSRYMFTTALLTTMACFIKNLADVFNTKKHTFVTTSGMKRKKLIIDILFCWLLPGMQVCVHYTITLGRYSIFPVYGCYDEMDNSWPYIVVYLIWGPILTLVSAFYAGKLPPFHSANKDTDPTALLLRGLFRYRATISATLASSGSGMNSKYFVKLTIIACSLLVIWIPCQAFYFRLQLPPTLHPYSFSEIHRPEIWWPIAYYPTVLNSQLQYNGWSCVAVSFMIFCYFGFNNDAIDTYRQWMVAIGLVKLFPSLKEPRHPPTRRGSSASRSSLGERLDLVGKAMKFFDGSRKGSQATDATTLQSQCQSRKGSHGTLLHTSTCTENNHNSHLTRIPEVSSPHLYPSPRTNTTKIVPRPLFSTFRTHIHLPFPLFPSKSQKRHSTTSSASRQYGNVETHACERCGYRATTGNIDLEAQRNHPSASTNEAILTPQNVHLRTDIWSETGRSFDELDGQKGLGLKMGTRAYREREEKEFEESEKNGDRNTGSGIGVVVENAMARSESDVGK